MAACGLEICIRKLENWSAASGGVTNGGLRGVWPPVLEIGRNRPFSPFFCLFRPFPEGLKSTWKIQKTEEKGLFPQISSDFLKPPSLKPPFAALQEKAVAVSRLCSGTPPGKSRKNQWEKIVLNCEMLQILGFGAPGKANLPGTLGPHCLHLVPTFRAGCILKLTVPAFSSSFLNVREC